MKKTYTEPNLQVLSFEAEDILMTSFEGIFDNELPIMPDR